MSDTHYALSHRKTHCFMRELLSLCREHKMAIVPTYGGEVSFHDSMRVIPLDEEAENYIRNAGMDPEEFK